MDMHNVGGEIVSAVVVPPGSRVLIVVNTATGEEQDEGLRQLRRELEQQFASEVTILVGDVRAVSVEEHAPIPPPVPPQNGGEDWPAGRRPWPPPYGPPPGEHRREEYETRPPAREPVEEVDDLPVDPPFVPAVQDQVVDLEFPTSWKAPEPVVLDDADDEGPVGP